MRNCGVRFSLNSYVFGSHVFIETHAHRHVCVGIFVE